MALPSTGPLPFSEIRNEFGGSNPIVFNGYYGGGSLVPAGTVGALGLIPSSGQISARHFLGASGSLLGGAVWKHVALAYRIGRFNYGDHGSTVFSFNEDYVHLSYNGGYTWVRDLCNVLPDPIGTPYFNYRTQASYIDGFFYALMRSLRDGGGNIMYSVRSTNGKDWTYPSGSPVEVGSSGSSDTFYHQTLPAASGKVGLTTTMVHLKTVQNSATGLFTTYAAQSYDGFASASVSTAADYRVSGVPLYLHGASYGVQQGGSGVLIAGHNARNIAVSANGYFWTKPTVRDPQGNVVTTSIAIGDTAIFKGAYYAICTGGQVISTQDGINFTLTSSSVLPDCPTTTMPFVDVCDTYALAVFKNASNMVVLRVSEDFVTWTALPSVQISSSNPIQLKRVGSNWLLNCVTSVYVVPI